jgi:hypothetical protein
MHNLPVCVGVDSDDRTRRSRTACNLGFSDLVPDLAPLSQLHGNQLSTIAGLSRKCLTAQTKLHLLCSGSVDHGRAARRILMVTHAGSCIACRATQISVKRSRHSNRLRSSGRECRMATAASTRSSSSSRSTTEVAALSSQLNGVVVVGRRIDALVQQQSFDDREVAITSSQLDGTVVVG